MKKKSFLIILVVFFISVSGLKAQVAKYQATYIFNFLSYVQWPKDYRSGNILVGVLGKNDPIVNELLSVTSGKKVGFKSVTIKPITHLGQVEKFHVLYIPSSYSAQLPMAVKKLSSSGTLLISSTAKGIDTGADINFTVINKKLGFELKTSNAAKKNITISSSLKRLAAKVY